MFAQGRLQDKVFGDTQLSKSLLGFSYKNPNYFFLPQLPLAATLSHSLPQASTSTP